MIPTEHLPNFAPFLTILLLSSLLVPFVDADVEYGGNCKQRCDKFRVAGNEHYELDCEELFESTREQNNCDQNCRECPKKMCDLPQAWYSHKAVIHCPKADEHAEKQEAEQTTSILTVVAIVIAVIMFFLGLLMTFMYCRNRKKTKGFTSGQGGGPQGPQGPQGYMASQTSSQSITSASASASSVGSYK